MGTTRIKVIDLSSDDKQIKTSRKHAEKLTGAAKIKESKKKKVSKEPTAKGESYLSEPKEPKTIVVKEEKQLEIVGNESPIKKQEKKIGKKEEKPKKTFGQKEAKVESEKPKVQSKHQKGKKYLSAKKLIENKNYNPAQAIELLSKTSTAKFDPSVEIHMTVLDKNIKGSVVYPHAFITTQKKSKYLIFADKVDIKSVDIIWGNSDTIAEIEDGKLKPGRDFDSVIASSKFMPRLAKVAKILGPKGMMPNPKNGTMTENIEKAVSKTKDNAYQFKSDPNAPIVHAKVGKLSQKPKELEGNLKTLSAAIGLSKIKKATLASSMSPGIRLDITTL